MKKIFVKPLAEITSIESQKLMTDSMVPQITGKGVGIGWGGKLSSRGPQADADAKSGRVDLSKLEF